MNQKQEIPTINTKELISNLSPQRESDESFEEYKDRMKKNKNILKAKRIQWFRTCKPLSFMRYISHSFKSPYNYM